jgi:hypothetical protein
MGRKVSFRCSVRLHRRLLPPFSDSLSMVDFSHLTEKAIDTLLTHLVEVM